MKHFISLLMALNTWMAVNAKSLEEVGVAQFGRYWVLLTKQFYQVHANGSKVKWFDEIPLPNKVAYSESAKLFVGAIPLHYDQRSGINYFHEIQYVGVNAVLSMVEEYEIQSREGLKDFKGYFTRFSPVTMEDWKNANIDQLHIDTPDFEPVSISNLLLSSAYIKSSLKDGKAVYVHCKSGVGRSVSGILAFLMREENMTLAEAFEYVSLRRPQIHLNQRQFERMKEFEAIVRPN